MFIIRANDVQFRCLKYRGQTSSAKRIDVRYHNPRRRVGPGYLFLLHHARELLDEG